MTENIKSPLFRVVDNETGLHLYCDTDRCGSNFFMIEDSHLVCNSCKVQPIMPTSGRLVKVDGEVETVVTNDVPVRYTE